MCLSTIAERCTDNALIQSGWKEFSSSGSWRKPKVLEFQNVKLRGRLEVPLDVWITAESNPVSMSGDSYESGFHIYADEQERPKGGGSWRRVYYRQVRVRGTQDKKTVVVAAEMFVPSQEDAWPPLH